MSRRLPDLFAGTLSIGTTEDMERSGELCAEQSFEQWPGFKIVGDNIDKNVRPSHQRLDRQTQSLHHFHSYAVRDRLDLSAVSDSSPKVPPTIDPATILPSASDVCKLQQEFEVLVTR